VLIFFLSPTERLVEEIIFDNKKINIAAKETVPIYQIKFYKLLPFLKFDNLMSVVKFI